MNVNFPTHSEMLEEFAAGMREHKAKQKARQEFLVVAACENALRLQMQFRQPPRLRAGTRLVAYAFAARDPQANDRQWAFRLKQVEIEQ